MKNFMEIGTHVIEKTGRHTHTHTHTHTDTTVDFTSVSEFQF